MTLRDLEAVAADAQRQGDARRMMAGAYVAKALRAMRAKNWSAARLDLIEAAHRRPELAEALRIVDAAERGAATSEAKAAAARANGAKGGRPRAKTRTKKRQRKETEMKAKFSWNWHRMNGTLPFATVNADLVEIRAYGKETIFIIRKPEDGNIPSWAIAHGAKPWLDLWFCISTADPEFGDMAVTIGQA